MPSLDSLCILRLFPLANIWFSGVLLCPTCCFSLLSVNLSLNWLYSLLGAAANIVMKSISDASFRHDGRLQPFSGGKERIDSESMSAFLTGFCWRVLESSDMYKWQDKMSSLKIPNMFQCASETRTIHIAQAATTTSTNVKREFSSTGKDFPVCRRRYVKSIKNHRQ